VDTDVDLEWWVWLASLGLGALFGGIIGVIVAAIVLAVIEAVAEGIVDNLISGGIGGALGGLPAIPLGPIGGGLTLNTVILDDFGTALCHHPLTIGAGQDTRLVCLAWRLLRRSRYQHRQRSRDAGQRSDLAAQSQSQRGRACGADDHRCLLRRTDAGPGLADGAHRQDHPGGIDSAQFASLVPFVSHTSVVFGMRTSDGRLAKVTAWRDMLAGGALHLDWVTYDTPVPRLTSPLTGPSSSAVR